MIVIDASTIISWVLDDEDAARAEPAIEAVAAGGAYVPGNFASEVAHALLSAERRGRIDEIGAGIALSEILALPLTYDVADPHVTLALARAHRLSCYDAAYLAVALQTQAPLATADRSLAAAARKERILFKAP